MVLAMAASGAQGDTRAAMLKSLGLDPTADPSLELASTIDRLAQSDGNAQLELAQAVWVQKGLKLDPAYVKTLQDRYQAQLAGVDFTSPDAPKVVNSSVDGATHHKIPELVDGFDPSVVGFIANATYFHALWRVEFDAAGKGDFRTFGGSTSRIDTMKRLENVAELSTPDYRTALLPYKGGRFSALVILPSATLSPAGFAKFLTPAAWALTLAYLHRGTGPSLGGDCHEPDVAIAPDAGLACDGTLQMPKFQLDYKKDLTDTLRAMGMPIPGELPAFCGGCALSAVVQKTYLQVDEKGTTAAAATGGVVATALREPMVVDRPFAFALIDNATDAPLFLGAIGNL
jgi:serine protease inhibitor